MGNCILTVLLMRLYKFCIDYVLVNTVLYDEILGQPIIVDFTLKKSFNTSLLILFPSQQFSQCGIITV